jgi:hypothetical protein
MDKNLELCLIEKGYNPINAKEVSLEKAGNIIKEEIYSSSREKPAGMILFDGETQAIVRTGMGHSVIIKPNLAIEGGEINGGLYINAPQENQNLNHQRSSVYIEKDGSYFAFAPSESYSKNGFNLIIKCENEMRDSAKVEFFKADSTKLFYLPLTSVVQKDKLFWEHIANEFGLKLNEIEPQYTDKSPLTPWYSAKHEDTGIDLTLGTRFRVYAVKSEFPKNKSSEELKQIIKGLNVNPQTVNNSWNPEFSKGGRVCETHINKGYGDQVVAYLNNLLKRK